MSDAAPPSDSIQIRDVWSHNLEKEFALIRELVDDFTYISMDTEFPGFVLRAVGPFATSSDLNYRAIKANVDLLKLIQLGLTLSDDAGNLPPSGTAGRPCAWQFNFREFDPLDEDDVFAQDSVDLLHRSGIDFLRNREEGVDARRFGELLMSSGIVLNDGVRWVTFHGGYDFGYLLKVLTCRDLPGTQEGFLELVGVYFPTVYDVKHMMRFCGGLHGGLSMLAEQLELKRVGACHQAGSDSLLTAAAFVKLKEDYLGGETGKYAGVVYGLGAEYSE